MTVIKSDNGGIMNYSQNYKISLWDEFKGPFFFIAIAVFIMIGLNNTFYTSLSIDKRKIDIAWSNIEKKNFPLPKENIKTPIVEIAENNQVIEKNAVYNEEVVEEKIIPNTNPTKHGNDYAIINSDVSVSAAEFYHPKLSSVLSGSAISGYLEVEDGQVKGLSVNINSDKTKDLGIQMISMGESDLQGNIFVYEIEGQSYTGTIYPTSPNEYMVSFVNGPWNGSRVKFSGQGNVNSGSSADEPIYNDDSYSAPETDMTNREWASSEN